MAGGFGTRLRPLTQSLPKPMVPVANLPMLHHIVNLLKKHGLFDYVTLLYFQPEEIKSYFKDGSTFGVNMQYLLAEDDFGTAGAVKLAEDFYKNHRVLIISGDVLTDFDLSAALRFHEEKQAEATIVLTRMENPLAYGVVITDQDGRISRFLEKPTWGEVFSDTINTGIYILEPQALERIPKATNFDFSQNLFPAMLKSNARLFGYIAEGYWRDVGNLSEYQRAHLDILGGKVGIDIGYNQLRRENATIWMSRDFHVDESARFSGAVIIGEGAQIEPGAHISNAVIGDRCRVSADARIENSVLWHDTQIGSRSLVTQAIICNDVLIESDVTIAEEAIISDHVKIRQGATVKANCKIWPGKEVEAGATVSSSLIWGEKWNRELFSDSKVSGLGNIEVTPEFAAKLGSAFGATLNRSASIVVSRGVSAASRVYSRCFMSGLLSCGVNVVDLRTLPIPVMRYELKSGRHGGGIHVRQNPGNYHISEIIFIGPDGMDLPPRKTRSIETLFAREDFRRAPIEQVGTLDYPTRTVESYRADLLKHIDVDVISERKFRIVLDFAHGGASEIFGGLFSALKCELISLNAYPDPNLPGAQSRNAVGQLGQIVKSLGADLGIQLAPSAEKITVVDRNGEVLSDQVLLLIITSLFLSCYPTRRIAVPVMASMGIEQLASEYGVQVLRVRGDHLAMMQAAQMELVDFVGGTRGGFILSKFQLGADGMFATIKLLEMLAKRNADLAELRSDFARFHTAERQVPCSWARKGKVMRLLTEHTEGRNRQLVDGARFQEDAGWVWIAPDRNAAYFTVLAEAEDRARAESLAGVYSEQVLKWQE